MLARTLVVLAFVALPLSARAESAPATPYAAPAYGAPVWINPVVPPSTEHWYGWQTLTADGASLAIGVTGILLGANHTTDLSRDLLYTSLVSYAVAAPAVHWGHGRIGTGFGSFGLRVGLPFATTFFALAMGPRCSSDYDHADLACIPFAVGGFLAGVAGAIAIDSAAFAREKVTPTLGTAPRFDIAPMITADRKGAVARLTF